VTRIFFDFLLFLSTRKFLSTARTKYVFMKVVAALALLCIALADALSVTPNGRGCFGEACASGTSCSDRKTCSNEEFQTMFSAFLSAQNRVYASAEERTRRFDIFVENMKRASHLASLNPHAMFGASPFADLTTEEFQAYHNGKNFFESHVQELGKQTAAGHALYASRISEDELKSIPESMDWREKGAVTPVKDQGQCGSCWAFSTTGGVEGQWFLAGNKLTALSEQELVSCDTVDSGCEGGLMNSAYEWILSNHSGRFVTEASYPYESGGGVAPACSPDRGTFGASITGHYNIYHDESQMRGWVATHGPLSLAVDASAWQLYLGGVLTTCGGSALDHGVLIVGYSVHGEQWPFNVPYWIFKNSWGSDWGASGYIYIAFGSDQCLLTHYPVTAIVKGTVPPSPPKPSGKYLTHTVYDDQECSIGAQNFFFVEGECTSWDGVSFKATCARNSVSVEAYYNTLNCTGASQASAESIGTCVEDNAEFNYYKNECSPSQPNLPFSTRAAAHFVKLMRSKKFA
jgi:cysteine peptidase B